MPSPPSLRSRRSNAVGVLAIRPYSRTSPRRPPAAHRDDDAVPVNIEPNVSDTIRHDPSPMHQARHRPTRRNPRYLHTVRRLAPYSGGHVVSYLYLPWCCGHFFYTQTKSNQRSLKRSRRTIKQNRRMIKRHRWSSVLRISVHDEIVKDTHGPRVPTPR